MPRHRNRRDCLEPFTHPAPALHSHTAPAAGVHAAVTRRHDGKWIAAGGNALGHTARGDVDHRKRIDEVLGNEEQLVVCRYGESCWITKPCLARGATFENN